MQVDDSFFFLRIEHWSDNEIKKLAKGRSVRFLKDPIILSSPIKKI